MAANSNTPNSTAPDSSTTNAQRLAELAGLVDAVKERVRAQYPESTATGPAGAICVGLPDLTPLSRARDAAAGKMAAIGTVNPRRGGLVNNSIQGVKRAVSRALGWFVRDQVVFNRQVIVCIETCIEALADVNRTIHTLAGQTNTEVQQVRAETEPLRQEALTLRAKTSELVDLASHWHRWREEWQLKLHKNEVEFLKSVADLNSSFQEKAKHIDAAFQYRVGVVEQRMQDFDASFARNAAEQLKHLHESRLKQAAELTAAFEKTAMELDASYQRTALQLEAACQQTAARAESSFAGTVVPLETGFRETVTRLEKNFRETLIQTEASFERKVAQLEHDTASSLQAQHDDFEQLANSSSQTIQSSVTGQIEAFDRRLAASLSGLQKQFYADLDRIRTEYEQVIHAELRLVRQRLATPGAMAPAAKPVEGPAALPFDYARFADRFRGPEQYVAEVQRFYMPYFAGRRHVLDIGCGRGEFLRLMREAGVRARGIEASEESVAYCRSLGLEAETADLFAYLQDQPEGALDGIFCSQVVEHLPAERLPEMVRLCASRLSTRGILVIETPNPECLAIFATHFYLDPTHTRPVPAQLLAFYLEEFGMGRIEVHRRSNAVESMPEVGELPEAFRERFFGGLDYAIIAYKL